jgi:glyoxylase-like metal-dependent hydrolase (beta-lactamase superfamily II)
MAACPQARLVAHPAAAPHLIDPSRLAAGAGAVYGEDEFAQYFGELTPIPEDRVLVSDDGGEVALGGRRLRFIHTPGHANHHHCVLDEQTRGWFTGDTFGISYREFDTAAGPWLYAPTTPVAFEPEAWEQSLDRLLEVEPEAMYLTHYCRVDRPERLVESLRRSIREQAAIALAEEDRPDDQRPERLRDALAEHLHAGARAHGVELPDERIDELLAVDLELNAQGLEVWLQRRAKRQAEATASG